MKNTKILLIVLLLFFLGIIILLFSRNNQVETFQVNGKTVACNELRTKRLLLKDFLEKLREPVQDISGSLIKGVLGKKENMKFQQEFTNRCIENGINLPCKVLASVDKYQLEVLPDLDVFYQSLLFKEEDLDILLNQLNVYSDMIKCSRDMSDNNITISKDIGDIDTESLFIELEKLSPYYLSPDVVKYILRFLISKLQLDNLNDTTEDYIKQQNDLVQKIGTYF